MEPFDDPTAARVGRRDDIRARNDAIVASARSHRFDDEAGVPLICECDEESCAELVRITLGDYDDARRGGAYVVCAGHRLAGAAVDPGGREYLLYRPLT
jgi:hypothetical protein